MSNITNEAKRRAKRGADELTTSADPVKALHNAGFLSSWAYIGGFASIGVSLLSWLVSRNKAGDDKAQADRWGIFIGHWAPTFFALGIALKHEEEAGNR